jgi:ligand-binding SRPBCC domain-containing protein
MATILLRTLIQAPVERCFLLSLSVDMHTFSIAHTGEKAVRGVTSGILQLGESVTWRARHLGLWQELTSRITAYTYPGYFCDEMVSGAFKSMRHEHHFQDQQGYTLMKDIFIFESPLGVLGKLADSIFLKRYMENLLVKRNRAIKSVAESDQWRQFICG